MTAERGERDEPEVERFDATVGSDWSIVAVAGPRRWRLGRRDRRARAPARTDGDTIRLAGYDHVLSFDRGGALTACCRVGAGLTISADARFAAGLDRRRRRARVVDLVSGEARLELEAKPGAALALSGDGAFLAIDRTVTRVADGVRVATLAGEICALSPHGELAVVRRPPARRRPDATRERGVLEVQDREGRVVATTRAGHATSFAWSGRVLALVAPAVFDWPDRATLLELAGPGRERVLEGVGSRVLALDATSGRFLVGGEHGAALVGIDGAIQRWPDVNEPLAIFASGASALVWVGEHIERVELATGRRSDAGDVAPDPVTTLLPDPRSAAVLVQTRGGRLRLWDTTRLAWTRELPRCRGLSAVTDDGELLVAIDERGVVVAITRDGEERWRASVADPPTSSGSARVVFRGAEVARTSASELVVHATFLDRTLGVEWEDPMSETLYCERVLRRADGVRVSDARVGHGLRPWRNLRTLDRDRVLVGGSALPTMPGMGDVSATFVSADGRLALVGTTSGHLVQLARAR